MKEARAQLEQAVGLEAIPAWGTDMVNREDGAKPAHEGAHEVVSGAEIEHLEPPANHAFL